MAERDMASEQARRLYINSEGMLALHLLLFIPAPIMSLPHLVYSYGVFDFRRLVVCDQVSDRRMCYAI